MCLNKLLLTSLYFQYSLLTKYFKPQVIYLTKKIDKSLYYLLENVKGGNQHNYCLIIQFLSLLEDPKYLKYLSN